MAVTLGGTEIVKHAIDNKKGFCIYIWSKKKKEETGPLLSVDGVILTNDQEKGEPLNFHLVCVLQRE